MTALIVLGCILLFLLLIAQIRVGGEVEYSQEGVMVRVRLGPLKITAYPVKEKPEKKQKKPKEKKPKKEPSEPPAQPTEKMGGTLALLKELLPMAVEAVGKFKRKLRIDLLILHLTWATGDPASTAMGFGAANAAVGMIYPVLDHHFNIRKSDVGVAVDFDAVRPLVYLKAALTLTIGQGTVLGLHYGLRFLSIWMKGRGRPSNSEKKKEAVTHE